MLAVILAGGLGTRLRSVVSQVPKPMAPVAGRPFLERVLDYWIPQGISELVLAVGYMNSSVRDHFGNSYRGIPISWSIEATPLGTGGALAKAWHAKPCDAPVLVLNGDTFLEAKLEELKRMLEKKSADGVVAVFEAPVDRRYGGLAAEPDGRITAFARQESSATGLMNGGAYVFAPSFFSAAPATEASSLETDWLPRSLTRGQALYACVTRGRFIDIGIPEDYARAADVLDTG